MPVPESDGSLAIHNIPNKKTGNTVKFGRDSYHEYRSRHKHTPPTKDTDKRKRIETVIVQNSSTNESSITSESSSAEDMSLGRNKGGTKLEDADKIIIYKILKSKKDKKCKHKKPESKIQSDRDVNDAVGERVEEQLTSHTVGAPANRSQRGVSFEELHEGES